MGCRNCILAWLLYIDASLSSGFLLAHQNLEQLRLQNNKTVNEQILEISQPSKSPCRYKYLFEASETKAFLSSPNYPEKYSPNSDCLYSISSPPGTQMEILCDEFHIKDSIDCAQDSFTISPVLTEDSRNQQIFECGKKSFARKTVANFLSIKFTSCDSEDDSFDTLSLTPYRFKCSISVYGTPSASSGLTFFDSVSILNAFQPRCSCGTRNPDARIVGGTNASVGEFPWRCVLHTARLGFFCGCTIIGKNWVLTAAHCTQELQDGEVLVVDIGDHDLSITTETNSQLIKVDRIVQHEYYNRGRIDYDISLLHLETTLKFRKSVGPICLPWGLKSQNFQGATATASGWGTDSSRNRPSVLNKVDLSVLTTEECREYSRYAEIVTNNMICTYSPGKDSCQGDSGGSLDYREPSTGKYHIIGIVSWGYGCGEINYPGVYTKVTRFLDWIQRNTVDETFCKT